MNELDTWLPCPFCGKMIENHPDEEWQDNFHVIFHDENCFFNSQRDFSIVSDFPKYFLVHKSLKNKWNTRVSTPSFW